MNFKSLTSLFLLGASVAQADLKPSDLKPGLKLQEGIEGTVFADSKHIQNPTALTVDEQGRIFAVETWRAAQNGVYGNRTHRYWLLDDNAAQTTEDRMEMLEKWKHKEDYTRHNNISEIVKLIDDTDGDGTADSSKVFADGFNHPLDGIAGGIFAIDGKVFFSCIPNVWQLEDTDGDGKADKKEVVQEGFGTRYSFWGHDLNGFKLGPDGRLYFTIGDRGFNITTKEGKNFADPGSGAVFRCELDGSNMEVFYHRLRNPKELAFDKYGFLFTGDNNGDMGDKARLVYCIEQGSTGWHNGMQFMHSFYKSVYPGDNIGIFKAWNDEKTWGLQQDNVRAYHLPPIKHMSNGPTGFTYNPGSCLDDRFEDTFFLVDYRGSTSQSRTLTFKLEANGAGFKVTNEDTFLQGIAATDVEFGLNGELYLADYIGGWGVPKKGNIIKFNSTQGRFTAAGETEAIFKKGFSNIDTTALHNYLGHEDSRVRIRASIALAKIDVNSLIEAADSSDEYSAMHATWGLGIASRNGSSSAKAKLFDLLKSKNSHVRRIAVTALGEIKAEVPAEQIVSLLRDTDLRVATATGIALSKIKSGEAFSTVVTLLAHNNNKDVFLRHGLIMALTGAGEEAVAELKSHQSAAVRLAAVVALHRLKSEKLVEFLTDSDTNVIEEAIFCIKDTEVSGALETIADLAVDTKIFDYSDLTVSRILNVNNILGGTKNSENLITFLQHQQASENMKLVALDLLLHWQEPRQIDKSSGLYINLGKREAKFTAKLESYIQDGLSAESGKVPAMLLKLASTYKIKLNDAALIAQVKSKETASDIRIAALGTLLEKKVDGLDKVIRQLSTENNEVALAALKVLVKTDSNFAFSVLSKMTNHENVKIVQGSIKLLSEIKNSEVTKITQNMLTLLEQNKFPKEAYLELFTLAEGNGLAAKVMEFRNKQSVPATLTNFIECLEGGDVFRGEELFKAHPTAQCFRCHKVNHAGGDVGPDLSVIGKQSHNNVLESIVAPAAVVAPGYGMISVTMKDGNVISGLFLKENDKRLQVKVGDKIEKINKADVKSKTKPVSAMPPMGLMVKKDEIRDIMAYLMTLKKMKSKGH